jgi:hypothetical protein
MANKVHQRLTVVKGSAEEMLDYISKQEGVIEPSIYYTKLTLDSVEEQNIVEAVERVRITNGSPSVGFDTKWKPLRQEQVQALLARFPEFELYYHISEELGNFDDEEFHFVNGEQVKHTVFPNWRMEADAVAAAEEND